MQNIIFGVILFFLSTACGFTTTKDKVSAKDVLKVEVINPPLHLEPEENLSLSFKLKLPPGYKAFVDQFKIKALDINFKIGELSLSPQTEIFDKFSKKNRMAVLEESTLKVHIEAPPVLDLPLARFIVTYQACTDTYCLFPQETEVSFPIHSRQQQVIKTDDSKSTPASTQSLLSLPLSEIMAKGWIWTYLTVFVMGVLTSFTPCVFPMIPITLSVLGREAHARTRWQQLAVSNIYVLGIALTYATLGVVAALSGQLFGSFLAHPAVNIFLVAVFFLMALSLLGLFEIRLPNSISNKLLQQKNNGFSGVFFSGLIAGVVASPCVGPLLVGILTLVAQTQDIWLGFSLLFVYALGLGQLFLIIGMTSHSTAYLPKSGPWLESVKHALSFMLFAVSFYYLKFTIPSTWWLIAVSTISGGLALYLGALKNPEFSDRFTIAKNYLYKLCLLLSLVFLGIGLKSLSDSHNAPLDLSQSSDRSAWQDYTNEKFETAKLNGQPIIIDFYADWCAACKELELITFTDPKVKEALKDFNLFKFDATKDSAALNELKSKYKIVGLPTLIFYDRKGELRPDLTLTEFEKPFKFIERLKKIGVQP